MIIEFSVSNFKTFKEKATISLIASNYDKDTRESENVTFNPTFGIRILTGAVIYGANASGKSTFINALAFMKAFVMRSSVDSQKGDEINIDPFRLDPASENTSSVFEIIFIYNDELYRYGFEISRKVVLAEWLYHRPKTKEIEIFYREGQRFEYHVRRFSKGHILTKEKLVRENALLISVAAQFNDNTAGSVLDWFQQLQIVSGLREDYHREFTVTQAADSLQKKKILALLSVADLSIQDITLEKADPDNVSSDLSKPAKTLLNILTSHRRYDADGNYIDDVQLSLEKDESSGTLKLFALAGPILYALEHGYPLFIDELDSRLHPNLVSKLIELYHSHTTNRLHAQLIFNTHDTNLLSSSLFRRDQIWFTEKNRYGAAKLYSLSDIKSDVRRKDNFEHNYIVGKYGAVPILNDFSQFIASKISIDENTNT
ncbi:AAA family ATPase [Chitinophaga rhizophila]|uniref:ATP-binding protein n=1 Tax=Chitinophaga rhizophila TaxID=2866212 RepID=A0ABS7G9H4_9BACT|nr:ATP-binding protein [Chitinophaga rhizophila]MBW8684318.1 ATP-binding protein [Chitinophaga rhizophila]